ncbi:MAG: glycosyltransferase, partial [Candidatus Riflebacteria bacterium]|nr:glycosyltransferase [Candidatus Riflebacteria bacterium]
PYSREVYSENHKKINIADWMSPLKIFDYMASKKPIIASNLPSIREILEDKKTSLLIDPDDICGWKNSIVKILCKPNLAKELSENAYKLLKDKYTWKLRAEKILENHSIRTCLNKAIAQIEKKKPNVIKSNKDVCKPKVVLHIIGDLNVGGAERNMLKIIPKLNNRQFQHRILTLFDYGDLAKEFQKAGVIVETANIPRNHISLCTTLKILKLVKAIRRINPDIIHTWLYHSNNLINILSPFLPAALINSIRHDNPIEGSLKTKISARIGAYISKLAPNKTIFCSESSKEKHENIGYKFSRTIVIPNGFTIEKIDKEKARKELKLKLNIPENHKIALTAARYIEEKDYPTILKAIKLTLDKYDKITFVLCGKGVDKSNTELISIINNLKIGKNLRLLGHQTRIRELMAGADLLISSSKSEAFPNVIAEAMSIGTPCVATNVGETKNIIGDTGFQVEPINPTALSEAIIRFLLKDDESLKDLGNKAKERIKNKYNIEFCISAYKKFYESVTHTGK